MTTTEPIRPASPYLLGDWASVPGEPRSPAPVNREDTVVAVAVAHAAAGSLP
jgi:hypothetical protein